MSDGTYADGSVIVKGLRVRYLKSGQDGPPLVLLHGSAIDSSTLTYGASMTTFGRRFRVFAPDWPGYGRSEASDIKGDFRFYSDFVREFLDRLELERAHIVGFSMGAAAALEFALERPARVSRLVLMGAYGLGAELHVPLVPYAALRFPKLDRVAWGALRRRKTLVRWFLQAFVFAQPRLATNELVEEVHAQLLEPGIETAFMRWLRDEMQLASLRTSYRERLGSVRAPTLLLHGARDRVVPPSRARRAATLMPDATLRIVPRCGHWVPREARDIFEEAVQSFLGAHPSA